MQTHLNTLQSKPINSFAFSGQKYEVRDMIAFFYNASHKKKIQDGIDWVNNLETHLERLKSYQFSQEVLCTTLQSLWSRLLKNVIQAIKQFEASYKASCPCAGLLPSAYIKRLNRIKRNASLTLLYIEI
jgi:hypothetical protein